MRPTMSSRCTFTTKETKVPSSFSKAAHLCVSEEELLLTGSVYGSSYFSISNVSSTGVALSKSNVLVNFCSTHWGSLRNVPWDISLLMTELDVFNAPPEIAKSITAAIWTIEGREYSVSWGVPETMDSGVVADVHIALVATWLEHECVSTIAPLAFVTACRQISTHFMPDLINAALAVRITWRENSNSV